MGQRRGMPHYRSMEERIWRYADMSGGIQACWPWTGGVISKDGYGRTSPISGRIWTAHVLSYTIFVGDIPEGMTLDHLCHTRDRDCAGGITCPHRRCVNPAHLEPTPLAANLSRSPNAIATINATKTACKRGHAFDAANTYYRPNGHRTCRRCKADQQALHA